jgi:hypothetical protein
MTRSGPRPIDFAVVHNNAASDRVLGCKAQPKARSMRRRGFISLKAYVIAGCFAVIMPADFAHAQPKKPTAPEDTLASKIKCQDFQKNSDGKWISNPNTRIGKMDFSTHTFGVGEVDIGGADLATVLNRKCVAR